MAEQINPIKLTDNETGTVYELDYNRDAIRFAEGRGFDISDVGKFPATKVPELFYYAFRKNHRALSKQQTDSILFDKLGGLSGALVERLLQLYQQAALTGVIVADNEDDAKNSKVTVEL